MEGQTHSKFDCSLYVSPSKSSDVRLIICRISPLENPDILWRMTDNVDETPVSLICYASISQSFAEVLAARIRSTVDGYELSMDV